MNPNLLRGTLYGVGASLWMWALAAEKRALQDVAAADVAEGGSE